MIIGNKSEFAIEFELNQQYGGVWLFGKFCFWIKDRCIGDYNSGTSLRDVLFQMKNIIRDVGNRENDILFALDKASLFHRLNSTLYGCEESPYYDLSIKETWARFNINIPVDVFDDWKMFIIENQEKLRIIAKKFEKDDNSDIYEFLLKPGEFDQVILRAYEELNNIYDQEDKKV